MRSTVAVWYCSLLILALRGDWTPVANAADPLGGPSGRHVPIRGIAEQDHVWSAVQLAAEADRGDQEIQHGVTGQRYPSVGSDSGLSVSFQAEAAAGDLAEPSDQLSGLSATEIFNRHILPILRADKPSSCTECHFGSVQLREFIREDQGETFASLRNEGLINVKLPDRSKLLRFIARQPDKEDRVMAQLRRSEYQTFRAWIRAAVREPALLAAKANKTVVGTELPVEVIRHMRSDRVLRSFVENIWSEMGRCVNCHSPERNQRQVREHGEQISWVVPHDPAATLQELVDGGNIDTDSPGDSMVLLKPVGLEDHGGGPKFAVGSRTDKNFRRFLFDYAAVINGAYRRKGDLPEPSAEISVLTGQHLRIVDLAADLDQKLLRADIYRWTGDAWSETPWGTAENPINGKEKVWQSMVFLVAPRDAPRAARLRHARKARLPDGRYLAKIFIDKQGKTKMDRDYQLGEDELIGQVEFDGEWRPGYKPPKIIHAPQPR